MSDAIVAKALNSTIGTPEFKGLDEIFDEHLNKLDALLKENIEGIKEAVMPVSNLSNPIYMYKEGDMIIARANKQVPNGQSGKTPTIRLKYNGIVRVDKSQYGNVYYNNAKKLDSVAGGELYKVSENSEFYVQGIVENDQNTLEIKIYGHTEFAPSLNIEVVE